MKDFSSILSDLRKETGRSQRRVASELGISQALLSHYENGAREPKLDFVVKACDYYDVPADYILGRSDDRGKKPPSFIESLNGVVDELQELISDGDTLLEKLKLIMISG